jgi:anaerobic selenocysteine-containing dehydrogenase
MKSRERVNRRGFLKGAAASAAAGAAAIVGPVPVLEAEAAQAAPQAGASH